MQNVVLIIHLFLAVGLIGIVLVQRSEGGGLGMGGGGGGGGVMSGRSAATAMGKLTWGLAIAFLCTSITLTILNAQATNGSSVLDQLAVPTADGETPSGDQLLPPSLDGEGSLLPVAE